MEIGASDNLPTIYGAFETELYLLEWGQIGDLERANTVCPKFFCRGNRICFYANYIPWTQFQKFSVLTKVITTSFNVG